VSQLLPTPWCFRLRRGRADEGTEVQFRLIYRGRLPAASFSGGGTRRKEKHDIRRALHPQLRSLWYSNPVLKRIIDPPPPYFSGPVSDEDKQRVIDAHNKTPTRAAMLADSFARCGYRFLPLLSCGFYGAPILACSLDILFLRRDEPGALIHSGGDIDNRIKTLFDALRVPQDCNEIRDFPPGDPDENPFFCLMEDDKMITEVKVTTDRLLAPLEATEHRDDVHLVIHVRTLMTSTDLNSVFRDD
jgi:hypothetical protein